MNMLTKELPTLIFQVLPGFVAAGVFYLLSAHPKPSEFERVIHALILTAVIKPLTVGVKWLMLTVGRGRDLPPWTPDGELAWSVGLAVIIGWGIAIASNKEWIDRLARGLGWTKRSLYPSEWYRAFAREERWVVLHLADQRRLYGWAEFWPDQPDKGHFLMGSPEWLLDNGERAPLYRVERILIPAVDVKMVEFVRVDDEVPQGQDELRRVEQLLVTLREPDQGEEEKPDGIQATTTGPQSIPPLTEDRTD